MGNCERILVCWSAGNVEGGRSKARLELDFVGALSGRTRGGGGIMSRLLARRSCTTVLYGPGGGFSLSSSRLRFDCEDEDIMTGSATG